MQFKTLRVYSTFDMVYLKTLRDNKIRTSDILEIKKTPFHSLTLVRNVL